MRRLSCDSDRVILVEDQDGEPLSIGRKSRVVPAGMRRALLARDKCCRFPGCGRTRFPHAHHAVHWSGGGETSLACLLLLCSEHHRLVHEGRFRLERDYLGRWFFKRPDGRAVPACGYRAADVTDDDVDSGEYLQARISAEAPVFAEAAMVREPTPDAYRTLLASAEAPGYAEVPRIPPRRRWSRSRRRTCIGHAALPRKRQG